MPVARSTEDILTITQTKKLWDVLFGVEYTVESMDYMRRKQGTKYTVRQEGAASWKCDCNSFIFHSGTKEVEILEEGVYVTVPETCKHIRHVMKQNSLAIRIVE